MQNLSALEDASAASAAPRGSVELKRDLDPYLGLDSAQCPSPSHPHGNTENGNATTSFHSAFNGLFQDTFARGAAHMDVDATDDLSFVFVENDDNLRDIELRGVINFVPTSTLGTLVSRHPTSYFPTIQTTPGGFAGIVHPASALPSPLFYHSSQSFPHTGTSRETVRNSRASSSELTSTRVCPICGSSLGRVYELQRHLRSVHTVKKIDIRNEKESLPKYFFSCGYCCATWAGHKTSWAEHVARAKCKASQQGWLVQNQILGILRFAMFLDTRISSYLLGQAAANAVHEEGNDALPTPKMLLEELEVASSTASVDPAVSLRVLNREGISIQQILDTEFNASSLSASSQVARYIALETPGSTLEPSEAPPRMPSQKGGYKCHICEQERDTRADLKKHLKIHLPVNERRYKCEICEKGFHDAKDLRRHLLSLSHQQKITTIRQSSSKGSHGPDLLENTKCTQPSIFGVGSWLANVQQEYTSSESPRSFHEGPSYQAVSSEQVLFSPLHSQLAAQPFDVSMNDSQERCLWRPPPATSRRHSGHPLPHYIGVGRSSIDPPLTAGATALNTVEEKGFSMDISTLRSTGTLDTRYRVRKPEFFRVGRVFKTWWPEPAGSNSDSTAVGFTKDATLGETMYSKIRWFVVVASRPWHCLCVPITTHRGNGAVKSATKAEQCVAYTSGTAPQLLPGEIPRPGERPMRGPICILPDERGDTLRPESRIDYGRVYTVEYNVKAMSFGQVDIRDQRMFVHTSLEVMNNAYKGETDNDEEDERIEDDSDEYD